MQKKHTVAAAVLAAFTGIVLTGCQLDQPSSDPVSVEVQVEAQIEKVFAKSLAGSGRAGGEERQYFPVADTYTESGDSQKNYGAEPVVIYKSSPNVTLLRKAFLRFDISGFQQSSVGGAFLELTNTFLQNGTANYASALEVSDTAWSETGLTWENMPAVGSTVLGRARVTAQGAKIVIDLTAFVNARLGSGQNVFSVSIQDMDNTDIRTEFASRESLTPPVLRMIGPGEDAGSAPPPSFPPPAAGGDYGYITVPLNKREAPYTNYTDTRTRALSSLEDFIPSTAEPALCAFGGDPARRDTAAAAGFFQVKKMNERWWMIDPDGCPMLNIGLVAFSYGSTPAEKAGQQDVYGDNNAWAQAATAHIQDLGFNGLGAWSQDAIVMRNHQFPYTRLVHFLSEYAPAGFVNDVLPVFDPAFEEFAETRAAETASLKNDPYLIGWFSDNELPASTFLLDRYLAIAEGDSGGRYSRAVAWEWLRRRYGHNASTATINMRDRDDFREFVYDYYAQIVSAAIKRHDPNHLYLGSRIHAESKDSPGIWRALGRYCEAIAFNHYLMWEPSLAALANWEEWSGRPVLISEFYVKAMDSGLANTSGAGWIVPTQNDRGLFYEQFVLALLESGSCVGWHWFKYLDNDPNAPASDPSNIDGNKGIINTAFQEYTALTSRMQTVNRNVFRLVDYFISKEETHDSN